MNAVGRFWEGRRVFVTGATGIVGSWLVKELLAEDATVVALVRDPDPRSELYRSGDIHEVTVVGGALEDYRTLERAIVEHEIDVVLHLGAQTIVGTGMRAPLVTFEANIRGTYNLLDACRVHADRVERVVIASSDKAYGEVEELPYHEDMPLQGRNPYDVSKSCADLLAQAYHHTYGLPLAIARCGNVYGGGDLNWSRIVPGTIRSLLSGEPPLIRSDGTFLRDYIYVKDVARAYMRVAELVDQDTVRGEGFNFSTDQPLTVLGLVEQIQEKMGMRDVTPRILDRAVGEIRSQNLSSQKARERLDWAPTYGLDEGLEETIAWYKGFLAA